MADEEEKVLPAPSDPPRYREMLPSLENRSSEDSKLLPKQEEPIIPFQKMIFNIILLSVAFFLANTVTFTHVTCTILAAKYLLEGSVPLSTLPIGILYLFNSFTTVPAGAFMRSFGYRSGFTGACLIGIMGSTLASLSLMGAGGYALFCVSMAPTGIAAGFTNYYRHVAAAEMSTPAFTAYAISIVITGGVAAAILGPEIFNLTQDLISDHKFAAVYMVLTGCYVCLLLVLLMIDFNLKKTSSSINSVSEDFVTKRPLGKILKLPNTQIALTSGTVIYIVMVIIMSVCPLVMQDEHFEKSEITLTIQGHVIGMFLPSLFTGFLIKRFGVVKIIWIGQFIALGGTGLFLIGKHLLVFVFSLLLVGLGWNFTFIGATTLLSSVYKPSEKFLVQSVNDLFVFGGASISAMFAGILYQNVGFLPVVIGALVCLGISFVLNFIQLIRLKIQPV